MSLFQKKTVEHSANFSLSAAKTVVIIGLGNPGKEYENTRHNVGFICLDALHDAQSEFEPWQDKKALFCQLSAGTFANTRVILVKPTTFMNDSGRAARAVLDFYKLNLSNTVAVYDELDVNFGQIRTRMGGGSAGHNGVKSLIQTLGENFGRVRVGIGPKTPDAMDSADFVLAKFNKQEVGELNRLKREVQTILVEYIYNSQLPVETRSFLV